METVLLGTGIALLWGSADTLAAKGSQHTGSAATTLIAQVSGLLLAALVALVVGIPTALTLTAFMESLLSGIVLGAIGALAYLTLYKALARGPLAVASPLVSAQGGVTLLAAILVLHELPDRWQLIFLLVIFVGVLLAATSGPEVRRLLIARALPTLFSPGIALALVSMLSFGLLAFGLGEASRASNWLLCVVWTRIFSCLLLAVFLRPAWTMQANAGQTPAENAPSANRRRGHPPLWLWSAAAVIVGCGDVGGLLLLALASTGGSIGVVGMVASAYGVIPLLAGILFFKERPAANQVLGVLVLIAGLLGVATPSPALNWPLLGVVGVLLLVFVSVRLCRTWLSARRQATLPDEWAAVARDLRMLTPLQQQELLGVLHETVMGLSTLALTRIPPCVAFFGSAHTTADDPAYQAAYETARLLAQAGFAILTTRSGGIMHAARRGAGEGGMLTVACLLEQTKRREAEEDGTPACSDVVLRFSNVASRQLTVCSAACAFVIFPGDLDTLDALYQAVRVQPGGGRSRVPIVLYEQSFWRCLFDRIPARLFEAGTIEADASHLFRLCDEPSEIAAYVTACLFPERTPQQVRQPETEWSSISRQFRSMSWNA